MCLDHTPWPRFYERGEVPGGVMTVARKGKASVLPPSCAPSYTPSLFPSPPLCRGHDGREKGQGKCLLLSTPVLE